MPRLGKDEATDIRCCGVVIVHIVHVMNSGLLLETDLSDTKMCLRGMTSDGRLFCSPFFVIFLVILVFVGVD